MSALEHVGGALVSVMKCDMRDDCPNLITHIGEKGWVYCAEHVECRQGIERCRRIRPFELTLLRAGKALPYYKPRSKAETLAYIAANGKD